MNIFSRKSLFGLMLCSSFALFSPNTHASDVAWKTLNAAGVIGSTLSFGFWAPRIDVPTVPLRLAIDAACVVNNLSPAQSSSLLNSACLIGSIGSLVFWTPAIINNINNPIYLARAAIDITNIILAANRLYTAS